MDLEDENPIDEDGLQNVIHSVMVPEEINGFWETAVDFGSAPIDAVNELFVALSKQGIKKVKVHSNDFLQSVHGD